MVQLVKKKLREQGSNFTYASAVKATLSSQVQDEIKKKTYKKKPKGKRRTKTNKSPDIEVMVNELTKGSIFSYNPGQEFELFKHYQNASERVNLPKLHTWVTMQKEHTSFELI